MVILISFLDKNVFVKNFLYNRMIATFLLSNILEVKNSNKNLSIFSFLFQARDPKFLESFPFKV